MKTNKRSPGRACGYRGAPSWTRPGALIFGTEPMELEAEAEAALLADELLARLVFDHNAWQAWRRRGFALGWHIAQIFCFRR
jgi:hypothetical protein